MLEHSCGPGASGRLQSFESPTPAVGVIRHGAGELWLDGRRTLADPSQTVLLDAGTRLRIRHHSCRGDGCAVTIHAEEEAVLSLARAGNGGVLPGRLFPLALPPASPALPQALYGAFALERHAPELSRTKALFVESCFRLLVASLMYRVHGNDQARCWLRGSELVRRVREAIALRATDRISFAELADELGRSRYHLCHTFKAETGWTMTQYLHRLRVWQGVYRIVAGQERLSELAFDLGFASHSHLTSVFRNVIGSTPTQLRSRMENWFEPEKQAL